MGSDATYRLNGLFSDLTAGDGNGEVFSPFRWQQRFLNRLINNDIPEVVDIPTGLGKTSVMALWLIALAEGASLPRRLVYVVDRRAVVDQATRFAEQLRCNMPVDLANGLGLEDGHRLPISTLRGGFTDNREWLEDPVKPAIVVGTIDMIGSRLLFQGYGVSRGMRPYHAGFLGADTLVVLDEAHLCPPFQGLLRQIVKHRDGKLGPKCESAPVTPPFRLMSLSATGWEAAKDTSRNIFRLDATDREEALVHQRLTARKSLIVTYLDDEKSLCESIANRAVELGAVSKPSRVLVYCDRRRDALKAKELIDNQCKRRLRAGQLVTPHKSELLVGERRVYERTELEKWVEMHGFLGGSGIMAKTPTFLVATSAGEVGVDLDADHMVCDLVPYERMVQRLGRVNRRGGKDRNANVDVFAIRPQKPRENTKKNDKEKYEEDCETLKRMLAPLRQLPLEQENRHDSSPAAIDSLKRSHPEIIRRATTPAPLHPELTRPLVDAWSMTSLPQHEGRPEVAPWLRGWEEDERPQTTLAWRKYLPVIRRESETSAPPDLVNDFFRVAPIHAKEKLEVPSDRVFDWLLKRTVQISKRGSDHKLAVKDEAIVAILIDRAGSHIKDAKFSELKRLAAPTKGLSAVEKRKRDRSKREWKKRLLPNSLMVLDARICGLSEGMLADKCDSEVPVGDVDKDWMELKGDQQADRSHAVIGFRVEEVGSDDGDEGLACPGEIEGWRHVRTFETCFNAGGAAKHGLAVLKRPHNPADEDERSILSEPQTLQEHAEQVAVRAKDLATRLELPDEEIEALVTAARMHDDGKAAERWQNAMNAPRDNGRPYAKTRGGGNWRLLEGYRHEFGSLLRAAKAGDLPESSRDLILHLIAAHHGYARPLISAEGCEDGPPSLLESEASEAALRFARLQRHYGPWGLAWREAVLRAADQSVSREFSQQQMSIR